MAPSRRRGRAARVAPQATMPVESQLSLFPPMHYRPTPTDKLTACETPVAKVENWSTIRGDVTCTACRAKLSK